jgi:hypothetical protein
MRAGSPAVVEAVSVPKARASVGWAEAIGTRVPRRFRADSVATAHPPSHWEGVECIRSGTDAKGCVEGCGKSRALPRRKRVDRRRSMEKSRSGLRRPRRQGCERIDQMRTPLGRGPISAEGCDVGEAVELRSRTSAMRALPCDLQRWETTGQFASGIKIGHLEPRPPGRLQFASRVAESHRGRASRRPRTGTDAAFWSGDGWPAAAPIGPLGMQEIRQSP